MAWLRFLRDISLLITVGVNAIVFCHVFPAFRRTKNRAFLFISIAGVLAIIVTVYDHTVTLRALSDRDYIILSTLRRFAYFADCIFWCVGIVLLTRPLLRSPAAPENEANPRGQGAAPNGGPGKPLGSSGVSEGPPSA